MTINKIRFYHQNNYLGIKIKKLIETYLVIFFI